MMVRRDDARSDGHYYAGMNTTQTVVSVPPSPPPPPSASPSGVAKSGDTLLWQPCESKLAEAQRWELRPTGQLALRVDANQQQQPQPQQLCATVSGQQLQLAPCSGALHDRFTFAANGTLSVSGSAHGHANTSSSCVLADRGDESLTPSLTPCRAAAPPTASALPATATATAPATAPAAPAAATVSSEEEEHNIWYDSELGYVHADGYCATAATNHSHPAPSPPPPSPPVEIFFRGRYNVEAIIGTLAGTHRQIQITACPCSRGCVCSAMQCSAMQCSGVHRQGQSGCTFDVNVISRRY